MADPTVLCAGDEFIRSQSFADVVRGRLGAGVRTVEYQTGWPDEPFGAVEGVREASGDPAQLAELVVGAQVLLTHLAPVTRTVLAAGTDLQVVGITRGGPVNVDLEAATAQGVPVIYLPGRNLGAVAEFVIGVMIALPRSIARSAAQMAEGHWDAAYFRYDLTGPELRASTVGLVGFGAVGSRVAELIRAFGGTVLAYDPYADTAAVGSTGAQLVELDELLRRSDIVSVHARLTNDTRGMFDRARFAQMKDGAYFVNTARGELVRSADLTAALESGHLRGAALDVYEKEPPDAGDPLLSRPDVIATPHLAGSSKQVAQESVERVVREVGDFLSTGELAHCANPGWSANRPSR